ncbi:MucR family transcriptional regulator [Ancylobacter oerskovii]|uniref:MucR family transcriptional regulator n=1 Tax=Ancylobacter oerskovii TaxID=459519 RepID=A0ABW4Z4E0_9HYPH|nr:MucR family transcriptional regulator [Ancylobacter oerskovii]
MPDDRYSDADYIIATTDVVSAFVSNNSVPATQLPDLLESVYSAMQALASSTPDPEPEPLVPAVPVRKSVTPEFLVCLEDGMKFRSLKRHLRTRYGMSPEQYRKKWGLPSDYPMVAPDYAAQRSALALQAGLGQRRRNAGTVEAPSLEAVADPAPVATMDEPTAEAAVDASLAVEAATETNADVVPTVEVEPAPTPVKKPLGKNKGE